MPQYCTHPKHDTPCPQPCAACAEECSADYVRDLPRMDVLAKLDAMMRGEKIITNDDEMELMLADDRIKLVRSMPNPNRVGIRDQYVAWID